MNSIFSETTYTGKSIVSDAYLVFNGQKIIGISKTAKKDSYLANLRY